MKFNTESKHDSDNINLVEFRHRSMKSYKICTYKCVYVCYTYFELRYNTIHYYIVIRCNIAYKVPIHFYLFKCDVSFV